MVGSDASTLLSSFEIDSWTLLYEQALWRYFATPASTTAGRRTFASTSLMCYLCLVTCWVPEPPNDKNCSTNVDKESSDRTRPRTFRTKCSVVIPQRRRAKKTPNCRKRIRILEVGSTLKTKANLNIGSSGVTLAVLTQTRPSAYRMKEDE